MRRPDPEALDLAAEWCAEYETDPERAILAGVAEWLRAQALEARKADFVKRATGIGAPRAFALKKWRELTKGKTA